MTETNSPSQLKSRKHIMIILLIMFTEVLGFSIVLPVIPFLGLKLGLNALQIGLILSVFSFCQLIASPITGKLSDRFGRKPILLISQMSTFIGFILLGIANSVWLLITARLVDGLIGSNMTVAQAYISDVTSPEERTKFYGYSSAVFGAGLIFGPVIGGTLSTISYSTPMFFAAIVCSISILFVILFLPESLSKKEEKLKLKFNDIIPIKEGKRFIKDTKTRTLLTLFLIYNFGFMFFISNFALFAKHQINLHAEEVGFLMSWIGILRVGFQAFLISPLQKKFGENSVLNIGIISMCLTMFILIFTTNYFFAYIPLLFLAFGTGVCRPILTSKLTKCVTKEETGSLLGVNNALTSLGQIITPIIGGLILDNLYPFILPLLSTTLFAILYLNWHKGKVQFPLEEPRQIP